MQRRFRRLALVATAPFAVACAADLPADERMHIVADSIESATDVVDSTEVARAQIAGCLEAYDAQFDVPGSMEIAGAKADTFSAGAAAAIAEHDYPAGEDPIFAREHGWPLDMPQPLAGSILPCNRVVAFYGNPLSTRMGILGEYPKDEMLRRFRDAIAEWNAADPQHPVVPALHLIVSVAQPEPGRSGLYRTWVADSLIEEVHGWAKQAGAILILDLQVGQSTVQAEIPRIEHFLRRPDVHVAIDPEFAMRDGRIPGDYVGTVDAADINWAASYLAGIVREFGLPPKLLIVHRFTRGMVTNASDIELRPEVQIVMDMDGWGAAYLKRSTYHSYIVREPVQYTGFKIFYHNDTKGHDRPIMSPADVLRLRPYPMYVQYQ